jgi:hypothetical protein
MYTIMNTYICLFLLIILTIMVSFFVEHHTIEGFKVSNINKHFKSNFNERFRNLRVNHYGPIMKKINRYI